MIKTIDTKSCVYHIKGFNNRYLLLGEGHGNIELVDIKKMQVKTHFQKKFDLNNNIKQIER